jgi:diguanylate cyclase (GGDEF)-like protein/putative nucleotidyltransferase with HDIG domain
VPLHFNAVALGLAVVALAVVLIRMALALRENHELLSASRVEATTDALTGLANRRRLLDDLTTPSGGQRVLVMFDLDGFKLYNDTFGHPAGDALLQMIGSDLAAAVEDGGGAYRLGGDEFCALIRSDSDPHALGGRLAGALAREGQGFSVKASFGATVVPSGATDPSELLRLADRRLYVCKNRRRGSADHQSAEVLLAVLAERTPDLDQHVKTVAELAEAVARRLGMSDPEIAQVRRAAVLHDIGKIAIPDSILSKPGPLDAEEWTLMRQHTVIGQRILSAAPALQPVANIVRATHERYDGRGYPDGLAGDEIPLAARIVFACDAYDAMTATRPYSPGRDAAAALAELQRCAGTQFDPAVVDALTSEVRELDQRDEAHALQ